jgi:RHS repeat-associated protein
MGRLKTTTVQYAFLTGQTFTNTYSYDAASNRTGYTAPDGSTNTYTYDTLNRLTNLSNSWAGAFGFNYDELSRRTSMTRPNSITTNYSYDSMSRLLSVLHQAGGTTTIDGATYTVDNVGNRLSKTNQMNATTDNYTYDLIYQLTQVAQAGTPTETYSYDAVGNRQSSLGASPYSYNNSNQLTSTPSASFTYDYNGNTSTKVEGANTTGYAWDFENRLTSVTLPNGGGVVSFKYDPLGRRIQKASASGTTNFVYDGAGITEELNGAGGIVAKYVQSGGIDEPLAMFRSGATSYYLVDGLGTVTSLTGGTGSAVAVYAYDSFGNVLSGGGVSNPFRYTGREFDSETGLEYYRARYYDPVEGRFISEDEVRFEAASNFYAYVSNNVPNRFDPSGHQAQEIAKEAPAALELVKRPEVAGPVVICAASGVCALAAVDIGLAAYDVYLGYKLYKTYALSKDRTPNSQPEACKSGKGGRDCDAEWHAARQVCRELLALPNPPRGLTGGYSGIEACARGFVSEECGGNPIDWGRQKGPLIKPNK